MDHRVRAIGRRFDRSAKESYDAHARVQRMMAERLSASLVSWNSECATPRPSILEIGCGTGLLTELVRREWPRASITALDIAPAMLHAAERRLRSRELEAAAAGAVPDDGGSAGTLQPFPVRFFQADVETWAASAEPASVDLIVSSACFQWLSRPAETLRDLRKLLRKGSPLAFTTFGPATFRELHEAFDAVYRAHGMEPQRHGLSFASAHSWRAMLQQAGFAEIREERCLQTERYGSVKEFLHSVKGTGASASEADASRVPGWRRLFAGMYAEYEKQFGIPGGVAATYELLQFHAVAP